LLTPTDPYFSALCSMLYALCRADWRKRASFFSARPPPGPGG